MNSPLKFQPLPDLPPPSSVVGPVAWVRSNLLSSPFNMLLTAFVLWLIWLIVPGILNWVLIDAIYAGDTRDVCLGDNATGLCWPYVRAKFHLWIYGRYPLEERWRVDLWLAIMLLGIAWLVLPKTSHKKVVGIFMLFIFPVISFFLLTGGLGLKSVETSLWGGLMLTLVIAIVGNVVSLPLGIVLALGRQAENLPALRFMSIIFIEFWRAVPLITVLFMSSVMLPLFLPEGVNFDNLLRALVGVTLFTAAYLAEVVRGGLAAIPKGQYEAAEAMGLSYWGKMRLIILPQALKISIPGLVNSFISLLKDTTLVSIIGLLDLLGWVQSTSRGVDWATPVTATSGYFITALMFWVMCFCMSRYSQGLERKLHTGHKR